MLKNMYLLLHRLISLLQNQIRFLMCKDIDLKMILLVSKSCLILRENIPVLNGSRIYKNTLDDDSITYDYGSSVTEILDEYTEDEHLIRSGMVDGRTYPVKLGADYRPLCNVYGVEHAILPKLNFIEGETDIQRLDSYLKSGNYIIEISAINPNESPEFLCPLNQEVSIYKNGIPYKTVSVIAHATVDFSLVESPERMLVTPMSVEIVPFFI